MRLTSAATLVTFVLFIVHGSSSLKAASSKCEDDVGAAIRTRFNGPEVFFDPVLRDEAARCVPANLRTSVSVVVVPAGRAGR